MNATTITTTKARCILGSDNHFGPRVNTACRDFDFTILFEDALFAVLPAAIFLLLSPGRLQRLWREPVKVASYKLATYKTALLVSLFALHTVYTAFLLRTSVLRTRLSTASGVLGTIATAMAVVLSFAEDQRSVEPSDLLVLYFSALTIVSIPRLRSLWLIPSINVPRGVWTAIYVLTVLALFFESSRKIKSLRPLYRKFTMEQIIGFWGRSFFIWVNPIFRRGYSNVIQEADIPETDDDLQGELALAKLQEAWEKPKPQYRLVKAVSRAYLWPILSGIVPRLALSGFTFCQPFLVTSAVNLFARETSPETERYGRALIGAFVLVYLGMAISTAAYKRQTNRLATMARAGLISMIYRHTTKLTGNDIRDSAAVTLMGTDVERIWGSLMIFHECWASMLEVAVAIYLLERQVYLACLVPAAIGLACILGGGRLSARVAPAQKDWVDRVQERITATSAMLADMKSVKMLGLTGALCQIISELRRIELKTSERFRTLLSSTIVISNFPVYFAPFATLAIYAVISVVNHDSTLLAARAFTSLALIALLANPLLMFVQAVPQLLESLGCFERIETYLLKKPTATTQPPSTVTIVGEASSQDDELTTSPADGSSNKPLVSFQQTDIAWSQDSEAILKDFSLDIERGITMIIGPVGSGKSTLMESILGETVIRKGHMDTPQSNIAFCAQTPWVMNSTIRHNITGGFEFDRKYYDFSLSASALGNDLEQLPDGDMHMAGSNGTGLSGGQKSRVALARAVYSKHPVFVLDDIFSGLDAKSISVICSKLFGKDRHFRTTGKSVILATHTQRLLPFADEIIVLNEGAVVDRGTYQEILTRTPEVALQSLNKAENGTAEEQTEAESSVDSGARSSNKQQDTEEAPDFSRRDGTWDVYKYYVKNTGLWTTIFFLATCLLTAFFDNFSIIWVQWWAKANSRSPNSQVGRYLGVYAVFIVLHTLAFIAGCYLLFMKVINHTAFGLHSDLLRAALHAPMSFFQRTDSGKTTNRFGQDMDLIDMRLPICVINFFAVGSSCLVKLIILCAVGKYLAATFPFLLVAITVIQSYYLRTSRQMRLLDIEAKSPLYTHFLETTKGMATIRAFGWERDFQKLCHSKVNDSQKPFYMLLCIQQWLTLVLDLVVAVMAVILIATTTSLKDKYSPGEIGVALTVILTFNITLSRSITAWTQLETSIGAVSRVQRFKNETPSECRGLETEPPASHEWPREGAISFDGITASYSTDSPPVLNNLSLNIKAKEKIAVCGSSGSGKTSLIMAVLQMINIERGTVSIDGRDLASMEPDDVRLRINVIPQDPFFMPGTVRFNLDPPGKLTDDKIKSAIQKIGLWRRVNSNGGLDMDFKADDWSFGERQLFALARALLVDSPILVLDEATSGVDWETEATMYSVIEEHFPDQTIISVMHRLGYVDRFDRVALLQNGELVECDSPSALLSMDSKFRKLYGALQTE